MTKLLIILGIIFIYFLIGKILINVENRYKFIENSKIVESARDILTDGANAADDFNEFSIFLIEYLFPFFLLLCAIQLLFISIGFIWKHLMAYIRFIADTITNLFFNKK